MDRDRYADLSVLNPLDARTINDTLSRYKKLHAEKIQPTPVTAERIAFRIHFPATVALYKLLSGAEYPCTKHAFMDMYLDTTDYSLMRQGIWYKKRYEFNYPNARYSVLETSIKQVQRDADDLPITCSKVPTDSLKIDKKMLPFASFSFMRHNFKTEFGNLWIEEMVFAPYVAYFFATAVVEDQEKFENFCQVHIEVRKALSLAPVASKVVELIRILRTQKPKHVEPLWQALLNSRTVVRIDWSSDTCKFNPIITGFPVSPEDEFWKQKGDLNLSLEEIHGPM